GPAAREREPALFFSPRPLLAGAAAHSIVRQGWIVLPVSRRSERGGGDRAVGGGRGQWRAADAGGAAREQDRHDGAGAAQPEARAHPGAGERGRRAVRAVAGGERQRDRPAG